MYSFDKKNKKPLGAQIEDELMKYILQEPVEPGQKIPNEFRVVRRGAQHDSGSGKRAGIPGDTGSAQRFRDLCDQYEHSG